MTKSNTPKKKTRRRKKSLSARKTPLSFRVNTEEYRAIERKAHLYFEGDISKLARTAMLNFKPIKKENGAT